jgi:hypothetical protein
MAIAGCGGGGGDGRGEAGGLFAGLCGEALVEAGALREATRHWARGAASSAPPPLELPACVALKGK